MMLHECSIRVSCSCKYLRVVIDHSTFLGSVDSPEVCEIIIN